MVMSGCVITATAVTATAMATLSLYTQRHSLGRLKAPPTHPADSGGRSGRRPIRGWDTAVADSGPTRPPSFPAPPTLTVGHPTVWTVPNP
jgi:hypothetical protein